jgi:hypothetical protein
MKSNKIFDLSVAGFSGLLIFIVNSIEGLDEYSSYIVPVLPFFVSLVAILLEWSRLILGVSSLADMKQKEASEIYQRKLEKKIQTCKAALESDITGSEKIKFQKQLSHYYQLQLKEPKATLKP